MNWADYGEVSKTWWSFFTHFGTTFGVTLAGVRLALDRQRKAKQESHTKNLRDHLDYACAQFFRELSL
jgi:hypothetical protein